jgi:hypothetical protein
MAYNDKYVNPQFENVAKTNHYSRLCKATIWPQPLFVGNIFTTEWNLQYVYIQFLIYVTVY